MNVQFKFNGFWSHRPQKNWNFSEMTKCAHTTLSRTSRTFQPYQKQSEGPFYSNMVISQQTPNVINMQIIVTYFEDSAHWQWPSVLFVGACFNHHHHPILAEDLGIFYFFANFVTEHELQSSIAQLSQISIFKKRKNLRT